MNKHYTSSKGGLLLAFALLIFNLSLSAQTNFGAFQDNNFLNPNNWTNGLPGPGNDANIGGGLSAEINADHTVDYTLTSYSEITVSGALTISEGGKLNNYSGSTMNIVGTGQLLNNGGIDQRGALNIEPLGSYAQGSTATYSSTGSATINCQGGFSVAGNFANLGTLNISSTGGFFVVDSGALTNNGTINISGINTTISTGTLTIVNGASLNILVGARLDLSTNGTIDNQGTIVNDGTFRLSGTLTSNGTVENNGLFENQSGSDLRNFFRFENEGTFDNQPNSGLLNEFELNNSGDFTNRAFLDNGAAINNLAAGSFTNVAGAQVNNQFGASVNNEGLFSNNGDIISVGAVNNGGTFVNAGSIYTNTGGAIVNNGNFTNDNLLSNLEEITNNGTFFNFGQLQNDSGGVFTNNGDLHNAQPARISNQFDLLNNQNLYNSGTIENGVRVYNYGFFENNGYLINIGDFLNGAAGVFENTGMSTTAGSNGGVLENAFGGVFTNDGVLNNYNEIFNFACSSFVNNGIINNYYWWTNYSLFFNYGTFNELPYHQMNMDGGVEITGPTSDEICEDVTVSLDENGVTVLIGSGISTTAFDTCSTLTLKVNGQDEITFTCADLGSNTVTLEIGDRTGNTVECTSTVTIVDDRAPEFDNCPSDIIVSTTTDTAPADWTAPTATDNCGPVNVTSSHVPGDLFPIGTTTVNYSATDGAGNGAAPCEFTVTVVPPNGDCADVISVRTAETIHDYCGGWCSDYALTFGPGDCYVAGDDLIFVEYANGSALLTGSVYQNGTRGFVDVCFTGRTGTPPSGSPKYELCVADGGNDWTFYTSFSGKITLGNGHQININRFGPAFQMGMGGNLQEPNQMGASGWFTIDGSSHAGDFNFRLGAARPCQNSIYLEAECADEIGSSWTVVDDANASGGKALLPPNNNSYDYAPVNTADLVTFSVDIAEAGLYRIFARASTPNGSSDSYWVRVNNGQWVKWNNINNDNYSAAYQWDIAGEWRGGDNDIPLNFYLEAGTNRIQFSWREAWACLDKVFITAIAKEPTGEGEQAENCGGGNNGGGGTGCTALTNLALGKTAYQSSTGWSGDASRAIDGNTSGNYNDGSVTHTDYQCKAYWELDLEAIGYIEYINLWNRTDCCSNRLSDFYVLVSDNPLTGTLSSMLSDPNIFHQYFANNDGVTTRVDVNRTGRYVCVMLKGCDYLSLAEVEVMGCDDTVTPPPANCEDVQVVILTDDYGSETTWKIKDANGNIVASGGPYTDGVRNRETETVCLPDGCYTFKIFDAYGDGICCNYGNGYYRLIGSNGDILANGGSFGYKDEKTFCINDTPDVQDCNKNALFVVGSSSLNYSDAAVKERLESLGYTVTVQNDDYCQSSHADDKGLILISSTVSSGKVGTKYKNVTVPVIVWESYLMDDMKMTGGYANHDFGTAGYVRNMTIADGNHPIAQGGSGDITMFDYDRTVTWGLPSNGATRIGHVPNAPDCVMLYTYDTGAHMVGMDAPARRVGFYLHDGSAHKMTNLGWTLFDRTIQWATGCDLGVYSRVAEGDHIELSANSSNNRTVNLVWKNNTGYKNDFFFIERSVDGRTWETISERNAYDEENDGMEIFSDIDPAPLMGNSFYRVSALLNDGTYLRSHLVQMELTDIVDYAVYPNPASTFAKVNLDQLQGEQNVTITLFDGLGKPVQRHRIDVVEVLDFPLDLHDFRDGIYTVTVQAQNKHPMTKKLIISK